MPVKNTQKILSSACLYFTLIVFSLSVINSVITVGNMMLTLSSLSLIFVFSLIVSAANLLLNTEKISPFLGRILHYFVFISAFLVIFIFIGKYAEKESAAFVVTVFVTIIYFLSVFIASIFKRLTKDNAK